MYLPSLILLASTLLAPGLTAPSGVANYLSLGKIRARTDPTTPEKPKIQGATTQASPPHVIDKQGSKGSFNIDNYIKQWLANGNTEQKISYAAYTDGGWESWAQYEIEFFIKSILGIDVTHRVREIQVYGDKKAADFTFDPSEQKNTKGMVIELKCENHNSEGAAFSASVGKDIQKLKGQFDAKYQDYDKVAIAMAYSPESQNALRGLGMFPSSTDGIALPFGSGKTLKIYRWDLEPEEGAACDVSPLKPRDGVAQSGCSSATQTSSTSTSTKSASKTTTPADVTATSKVAANTEATTTAGAAASTKATTTSKASASTKPTTTLTAASSTKGTTTPKVASSTKTTTTTKVAASTKAATTPKAKASAKKSN